MAEKKREREKAGRRYKSRIINHKNAFFRPRKKCVFWRRPGLVRNYRRSKHLWAAPVPTEIPQRYSPNRRLSPFFGETGLCPHGRHLFEQINLRVQFLPTKSARAPADKLQEIIFTSIKYSGGTPQYNKFQDYYQIISKRFFCRAWRIAAPEKRKSEQRGRREELTNCRKSIRDSQTI